jgi:hypothetical protein
VSSFRGLPRNGTAAAAASFATAIAFSNCATAPSTLPNQNGGRSGRAFRPELSGRRWADGGRASPRSRADLSRGPRRSPPRHRTW